MKIVWTKHAEGRQKEWEKKKGVSEVEDLVKTPEQVVPGDMDTWVHGLHNPREKMVYYE